MDTGQNTDSDLHLLRRFASGGDEAAFTRLVERHAGMVRGAALRCCAGDADMAGEVTQSVFALLARRAASAPAEHLGGWLHNTALLTARNARRAARRYQNALSGLDRRTEFMSASETTPGPGFEGSPWEDIRPHLDEAVCSLPESARRPVILRFFENKSVREIAALTGKSEAAVRKGIERALERLSTLLKRRGIMTTGTALGVMLSAQSLLAPPASAAALAAVSVSTPSALLMTSSQTKTAAAAVVLILAAAVPSVMLRRQNAALQEEMQALRTAPRTVQTPERGFAVKRSEAPLEKSPVRPEPKPATAQAEEMPADPAAEEGAPMDIDALSRGKTAEKAAVLRTRLSLTPEQEEKIAKALEYGQIKFKISPPNVIPVKPTAEDLRKMEDAIAAALTADQWGEYETFRAEERANVLEAAANRELSNLQSMLTLSPEQKDRAFAVLSDIASRESALPVLDPDWEAEAIRETEKARWAERREALGAILTPEQMALYRQAGNPFRRGSGG